MPTGTHTHYQPTRGRLHQLCSVAQRKIEKKEFCVSFHRAEGTPGDSDRYPRTNLVARFEGDGQGPCVHFNGHLDVVVPGKGWSENPLSRPSGMAVFTDGVLVT